MKVKECMSLDIVNATTQNTVYDVAKLMNDNHVGAIPVCDSEKKVLGIITDRDIVLRCIACDKDIKQTPASEVMSTNVITENTDADVSDASKLMSDNQIRRLPILENEKLVGMLTIGDLAQTRKVGGKEVADTMQDICNCNGQVKNSE